MITVEELTKSYSGRAAVQGLSFTVRPGVVTGFLGPNGAGKSTTMRIVLGLARPDSGRALVQGQRYAELPEPLRTVGSLLDAGFAHPGRTARAHLLWLARSNRIEKRRVGEVLATVGLQDVARTRVGTFSLGMRQRLGLAAALLGDPGVLMLDEPVNGLDPEGVRWLREFLRELAAQGRTVLVSSHLMSEMALVADHLVVIGRGRLLADTSTVGFVERHARPVVRVRTPQPERLLAVLAARGLDAATADGGLIEVAGASAPQVGRLAAENGLTLDELGVHSASLEDAFLRLTENATDYAGVRGGNL